MIRCIFFFKVSRLRDTPPAAGRICDIFITAAVTSLRTRPHSAQSDPALLGPFISLRFFPKIESNKSSRTLPPLVGALLFIIPYTHSSNNQSSGRFHTAIHYSLSTISWAMPNISSAERPPSITIMLYVTPFCTHVT